MGDWIPKVDELAVELRHGTFAATQAGRTVTVTRVTPSLIVTDDGERYNRFSHRPYSEGPSSNRELVSASDPRVLVARGHALIGAVAQTAENLAKLDHRSVEDVMAALSEILMSTSVARQSVTQMMTAATAAEQARG
jgi:hypothetical protein